MIKIIVLPNGKTKWVNKPTEEERVKTLIDKFTEDYQASLPPIQETMLPLKPDNLEGEEGNRWVCCGGPLDGWGIAKLLRLKKGRGKSQVIYEIPINPESFTYETATLIYTYTFNGEEYISD